MKKRIIPLLMVLCILLSLVPTSVLAVEVTTSGTCGENLTWELTNDGTLNISGTGEIKKVGYSYPWDGKSDKITAIVISEGITSIADGCFYRFVELASVQIPSTLVSFGKDSFYDAGKLMHISVAGSNPYFTTYQNVVYSKDMTTLVLCPRGRVTPCTIPNGVTTIAADAFLSCRSLTGITIPKSVTTIEECAFMHCNSLTSLQIPDSVTSIGKYALHNCHSLTSLSLSDSLTELPSLSLSNCEALPLLVLPKNLTTLGQEALSNLIALDYLVIPESLDSIFIPLFASDPTHLFYCGTEEQWNDLDLIGKNETSLTGTVHYNYAGSGLYETVDGYLAIVTDGSAPTFRLDIPVATEVRLAAGSSVSILAPETDMLGNTLQVLKTDGTYTAPASVEMTEEGLLLTLEEDCKLAYVEPSTVLASGTEECGTRWQLTADGTLTVSDNMKNYSHELAIDYPPWFAYREQIRNVVITEGVPRVGDYAFTDCKNLVSVSLPESVTFIGGQAFGYCEALQTINLPDAITTIRPYAFYNCKSLQTVDLPNSLTVVSNNAFRGCSGLTSILLPEGLTTIDHSAFEGCSHVTQVTLPSTLTKIGQSAFRSWSKLEKAWFIGTLDQRFALSIGNNNKDLTNVLWCLDGKVALRYESGAGILRIDAEGALADYEEGAAPWSSVSDSCKIVVLSEDITGIGANSFSGFEKLRYICLGSQITAIHDSSFQDCANLTIHTDEGTYAQSYAADKGISVSTEHSFEVTVVEVHCDYDGFTLHHCTECHLDVYSNVQEALGHNYQLTEVKEPTCTEAGFSGNTICVNCGKFAYDGFGDYIDPIGHSWSDWTVTVQPSAQANGEQSRVCGNCSETEVQVIFNNPFTDVGENNRFKDSILWAYYEGITAGKTPTTFAPDNTVTRVQAVAFLWRAAGCPEPASEENPFTDVGDNNRFKDAILWAFHAGITSGKTATTFCPDDPCTRVQIVTFLYRFAGEPEVTGVKNPFEDLSEGNRFYEAILWAYANCITSGKTETAFDLHGSCTRAQIVTFLYRYAS